MRGSLYLFTALEKVQRKFTKRLPSLCKLSLWSEARKKIRIAYESRHFIFDLVTCHKIVFGLTCLKSEEFLPSVVLALPVAISTNFVPYNSANTRKHFSLFMLLNPEIIL